MLKSRLIEILEDYFAVDAVFEPKELIDFRKKLIDFLRAEENLLVYDADPNILAAKDMIHLLDAHNTHITTYNRDLACKHIQPFFDRLLATPSEQWGHYDLRILSDAVAFAPTAEITVELGAKSIMPIVNGRLAGSTDIIQGMLAGRICSRLLYAKYFDPPTTVDLGDKFSTWFKKLERLAENNEGLSLQYLLNQIRHALFHQNQEELFRLNDEMRQNYPEQVANHAIAAAGSYTSSKNYNAMLHEGISD